MKTSVSVKGNASQHLVIALALIRRAVFASNQSPKMKNQMITIKNLLLNLIMMVIMMMKQLSANVSQIVRDKFNHKVIKNII